MRHVITVYQHDGYLPGHQFHVGDMVVGDDGEAVIVDVEVVEDEDYGEHWLLTIEQ